MIFPQKCFVIRSVCSSGMGISRVNEFFEKDKGDSLLRSSAFASRTIVSLRVLFILTVLAVLESDPKIAFFF